jgi:hypothetical protein
MSIASGRQGQSFLCCIQRPRSSAFPPLPELWRRCSLAGAVTRPPGAVAACLVDRMWRRTWAVGLCLVVRCWILGGVLVWSDSVWILSFWGVVLLLLAFCWFVLGFRWSNGMRNREIRPLPYLLTLFGDMLCYTGRIPSVCNKVSIFQPMLHYPLSSLHISQSLSQPLDDSGLS